MGGWPPKGCTNSSPSMLGCLLGATPMSSLQQNTQQFSGVPLMLKLALWVCPFFFPCGVCAVWPGLSSRGALRDSNRVASARFLNSFFWSGNTQMTLSAPIPDSPKGQHLCSRVSRRSPEKKPLKQDGGFGQWGTGSPKQF